MLCSKKCLTDSNQAECEIVCIGDCVCELKCQNDVRNVVDFLGSVLILRNALKSGRKMTKF